LRKQYLAGNLGFLSERQTFSHYRFRVGPYGADSTSRQPSEWTLFVRGDAGGEVPAGSEQNRQDYSNQSAAGWRAVHSATAASE